MTSAAPSGPPEPPVAARELEAHLASCEACRRAAAHDGELAGRLASAGALPPTIALIASPSLDSAIGLLRAGIDDLQMLDVQCRPRVASIKLRASRGSAELERVFVTYGNGERESLPVRRYLDRGQETRWLDLTGRRRCVTAIGIIGDSERGWNDARRDDDRYGRGRHHGRGRGHRAEIEVLGRF